MKTINFILFLILAGTIYSCDVIEPPYKKGGSVGPVDTTKRKVLIEDFTGFRCGNCPEASDKAWEIHELYPDNVIVIALHAGGLAIPTQFNKYEFRTTETMALADHYQLPGTPFGLINRRKFGDSWLMSPTSWGGNAIEVMGLAADLKINLTAGYNAHSKEISLNVKLDYIKNSSVNHFIAAYIIEDSIVQFQIDDRKVPSNIKDFVHNHVVRGSFTGTWGTQVSPDVILAGNSLTLPEMKYTIPETKDWRPEKLSLVVFVHDNTTKEILQVEKIPLFK